MKNILNKLILFSILLVLPSMVFSQKSKKVKREKIEQLKIEYFTENLNLSSDEAEKFWPIYNEMQEKIRSERKHQHEIGKDLNENRDSYSDASLKTKTDAIFDSEIKQVQLKKEYNSKIATAIGRKKATKLLSLEKQFKRELLKKLKKENMPPPPPEPPH